MEKLRWHNNELEAVKDNPGVQVGTSVHVYGLAYTTGIVLLSSNSREMQDLLETVNHVATVGMRLNTSKTKVMSALIPGY